MFRAKKREIAVLMMRKNKKAKLPLKLRNQIVANGHAMEKFYTLSTEERQRVLETITRTNELIDAQADGQTD